MKALTNGIIVTENQMIYGKTLVYDDTITEITSDFEPSEADEVTDVCGNMITAGLVDLHIHGYAGFDTSDGSPEDIKKMALLLAQNGVTSWCPTTMTVSQPEILKAFDAVRAAKSDIESGAAHGARILGVNCEGPFISPNKKGAQDGKYILPPSADFVIKNSDIIKLVTIAPEMDDNCREIKKIAESTDVVISMGHTEATLEQARLAIESGARHVTHLYNAMPRLDHRAPGLIGAVMTDRRVSCEMIADTFHINPALFEMTAQLKGDKLVLITDCMRAGGMPDGSYTLGGQPVTVHGVECRLEDGTIAGSVLKLNCAVRNLKNNTRLPLWKAINAASLNAADSIGESGRIGSIAKGKYADFAVMDKDFNVKMTVVGGETVYNILQD